MQYDYGKKFDSFTLTWNITTCMLTYKVIILTWLIMSTCKIIMLTCDLHNVACQYTSNYVAY